MIDNKTAMLQLPLPDPANQLNEDVVRLIGALNLIDSFLSGGGTINDLKLGGVPTAPTAAAGTNTTQVATTAYVRAAINALLDGAPAALDTLNELAAALGDNASYATTITNALALKAPLASPVFTGNPTAPTPAQGDNDTSLATTAFVQGAVGNLGGLVKLASGTVSAAVAAIDITTGIDATYDEYELHLQDVRLSVAAILRLYTSDNGGSSYATASIDYSNCEVSGTSINNIGYISLGSSYPNAGNAGLSGVIKFFAPSDPNTKSVFLYNSGYVDADGMAVARSGSANRRAAGIVNALRVSPVNGNITSGKYVLYGVKK